MSTTNIQIKNRESHLRRVKAVAQRTKMIISGLDAHSPEFALLQYSVGATHALHRFLRFDRALPKTAPSRDVTLKVIEDIEADGDLESDEVKGWRAGFYFNSAILRIDAVCERALRIINEVADPKAVHRLEDLRKGVCSHIPVPELPGWDAIKQVR